MENVRIFFQDFLDLFGDLATPFRAMIVSLLGVYLAWQWFNHRVGLVVVIGATAILFGVILERLGSAQLPDNPVLGLRLMEFLVFTPAMIAAIAAGALVVISVELTTGENTPLEIKQLITALTAGVTTFLASSFISWTSDQKDSRVADQIRKNFQRKYKRYVEGSIPETGVRYFKPESVGERWVYSEEFKGIAGWGGPARWKRARGIADELAHGTSDP